MNPKRTEKDIERIVIHADLPRLTHVKGWDTDSWTLHIKYKDGRHVDLEIDNGVGVLDATLEAIKLQMAGTDA